MFLVLLRRLAGARDGNIAVFGALASLPLIAACGFATDYLQLSQLKQRLTHAADAAIQAGVNAGSTAARNDDSHWMDAAMNETDRVYADSLDAYEILARPVLDIQFRQSGSEIIGKATFSFEAHMKFMPMIGISTISVSNEVNASSVIPAVN